ncbi:MAG TPA: PDZ domain-containing protein [Candidatus Sulfotelmatobacter sp.]|nr:PDZ domain-containing protein [Candidatus Sulfotelmatobacter sp.]
MKPATWRAMLLTLCAVGILLAVGALVDQTGMRGLPARYGVWGAYFDGSAAPYHMTLRGVDPGGPADRSGLHEGDLIDLRASSLLERLSLMGQPQADRPVTLRVERGSARSDVVIVPKSLVLSRFWNLAIWEVASLWLLFFAALIAWRRPYVDSNLLLSAVLACTGIGVSARPLFFGFPWASAYVALSIAGQALPLSIALWAALASRFARPLSPARRGALALCYALVAVAVVTGDGTPDLSSGIAPLIATLTLWFDPTLFLGPLWIIPMEAAVLMALLGSAMAIAAGRGVDRQRAVWLLAPLAVLDGVRGVSTLSFHFLSYSALLVTGEFYSIVAVVTPLVLTYVALNRRLIDLGFVVNRTVVFAIISTIVVGAFVLVEWAVGAWLVNASHTTSAVVAMVVALALGFSLRSIHKYVDRVVDTVLFRKRHDDELALRRFAHESAYITDAGILLERALETVRERTAADVVEIFVRSGSARYVSTAKGDGLDVSENDPVLIALAAWNKPVALHGIAGSALCGELAFPMISRGRLVGALICGAKRDGDVYAPDESDALLALAHGVADALDVLDAKGARFADPELVEIRQSIRALSEATSALPDAIAARVRAGSA